MKKKWLASATALVALSSLAVGCGTTQKSGGTSSSSFKVGLVTDTGGLNDHSFNYLANQGVVEAKSKLGVQTSVVQSQSESDYVPNLTRYAQQGYNVVIAVGFLMTDAVKQVAKEFPKTKFLLIDDSITNMPNVTSAIFQTEQVGYLAGAMAGLVQKDNALPNLNNKNAFGVIGGQQIPPVTSYIAGFQQGLKKTDPGANLQIKYTNSFTDQAMGSQYAQNEMASGADIIFPVAGACGTGAINAVKDAKAYAIGVDADQRYLAPSNILTSAMKGVDTATFDVIEQAKDNKFKSGVQLFNLANGGVKLGTVLSGVPSNIVNQVNDLQKQIVSGTITVSPNITK